MKIKKLINGDNKNNEDFSKIINKIINYINNDEHLNKIFNHFNQKHSLEKHSLESLFNGVIILCSKG